MSIKYKVPLYLVIVFLLFIPILFGFFKVFLNDDFGRNLDSYWEHYEIVNEGIISGLMQRYPDTEEMESYLQQVYDAQQISVRIMDTEGRLVMETEDVKRNLPILKQKELAFYQDNLVYTVEIMHPYPLRIFRWLRIAGWRGTLGGGIRLIILLLLAIIVGTIIIYLHYAIVKPLLTLQKSLDKFNYDDLSIDLPYINRDDEIGYFCQKFLEMTERLKESRKKQVDLILSISHDLKTPLTSVIGFSERLLSAKQQTEERRQEYYQIIHSKARDMNNLLEEFH